MWQPYPAKYLLPYIAQCRRHPVVEPVQYCLAGASHAHEVVHHVEKTGRASRVVYGVAGVSTTCVLQWRAPPLERKEAVAAVESLGVGQGPLREHYEVAEPCVDEHRPTHL